MTKYNTKTNQPRSLILSKTDRRILNEKLQKWGLSVDRAIDSVHGISPTRIPGRTREAVIAKHTRTLKHIKNLIKILNEIQ